MLTLLRCYFLNTVVWCLVLLPVTAFASFADVDGEKIIAADSNPAEWLSHGRTYSEQRFSPLDSINDKNVKRLGLAWSFELPTRRGQEATPIVVDNTIFISGSWSQVFALDARSGKLLWQYDPRVPRAWARYACCDVVNRGVAVWGGKVFFGSLDGRLIALDARSGELVWEVQTTDRSKAYTITGAPRIVKDKVLIGNGGAEYGVRGYVSAYNVDTGEMEWRFYTVPGNPDLGFESNVLAKAAKTWTGEWWKLGGGGTVWDSMAYDPELDLLYIGVGNGSPWNRELRSPDGGDNLFLSSIVALKPETGEYVWHYQTTPAESWDYTATQHMILAELTIGGEQRKVLMQAPKNGFFYVIDRETGELISANNYVPVTWASHVNLETGRPVEALENSYSNANKFVLPAPIGGHNWMPMAYSPLTNLVYVPAIDVPHIYRGDPEYPHAGSDWQTGTLPEHGIVPIEVGANLERAMARKLAKARLLAWDPVNQREVWRVDQVHPWNGGVLATAGNLVFQGDAVGFFSAYAANTGELLWQQPANTGIVAAPVSYSVDDTQYVAVLAGWGGSVALFAGAPNELAAGGVSGRLLVYRLDGEGTPPAGHVVAKKLPDRQLDETATDVDLRLGFSTYASHCAVCHGFGVVGGGVIPDLRYMSDVRYELFEQIVGEGLLAPVGMPSFEGRLSDREIAGLKAYISHATYREREYQNDPRWWRATKRTIATAMAWALTTVS